jgi:hypothetical protein
VKSEIKYIAIQRNADKYPVKQMCEFFEVSRSGYYAFLKRPQVNCTEEALAQQISQCQKETGSTYGYRRVCIWLERHGQCVNHKAVLDHAKGVGKQQALNNINSKAHLKTEGDGAGETNDIHMPADTLSMYMDMGMTKKQAFAHYKKLYG